MTLQQVNSAIQQTTDRKRIKLLNRLWWKVFFQSMKQESAA